MLSLPQLQDVCLYFNQSDKCRYLERDTQDWKKYYCKKKTPDASHLDELTEEYILDSKKKGVDPKKGKIAIGDNCSGYPFFKDLLQGYNLDE